MTTCLAWKRTNIATVLVDGEQINLAELIVDLTQFVTAEDLRLRSVMFPIPQNVADLSKWVAANGMFSPDVWGRRLERTMNTFIRGRPIHSHAAERGVKAGQEHKVDGAHAESHERTGPKAESILNNTRPEWRKAVREAYAEFTDELDASEPPAAKCSHWRDAQTGTEARAPRRFVDWRSKEVTPLYTMPYL